MVTWVSGMLSPPRGSGAADWLVAVVVRSGPVGLPVLPGRWVSRCPGVGVPGVVRHGPRLLPAGRALLLAAPGDRCLRATSMPERSGAAEGRASTHERAATLDPEAARVEPVQQANGRGRWVQGSSRRPAQRRGRSRAGCVPRSWPVLRFGQCRSASRSMQPGHRAARPEGATVRAGLEPVGLGHRDQLGRFDAVGARRTRVAVASAAAFASLELAAALVLWRRRNFPAARPRPPLRNLLAATCGCGRRIEVAQTTLAEAPILCGALRAAQAGRPRRPGP